MAPEIADPRRFPAPLDPGSVHQGAALEARPLDWGRPEDRALGARDVWVALDRVTDPHNVGAILRSAAVFGAAAVLAPARHAAPETGALAKAASGALEAVPYLRVPNLGNALAGLSARGLYLVGLAGEADRTLGAALAEAPPGPRGIVLGARGGALRRRSPRQTPCRPARRLFAHQPFKIVLDVTARAWRWPWRSAPATRSSRLAPSIGSSPGGEDLGDADHIGVVEAGAEILEQVAARVAVRLVHGDHPALRSATAWRAAFSTAAISTGWWP
jgi:hypothetical protein